MPVPHFLTLFLSLIRITLNYRSIGGHLTSYGVDYNLCIHEQRISLLFSVFQCSLNICSIKGLYILC